MATQFLKLRALAVALCCVSLLPVACGDDDDNNNPTPGTGGTSGKGGTGGKGGASGKGGTGGSGNEAGNSEAGTGATGEAGGAPGTGGTGTGGSGAKGGSGGSGAKGGSGGKGGTGGSGNEGGNTETGGAGSGNTPELPACTDSFLTTYKTGSGSSAVEIACYGDCAPKASDDCPAGAPTDSCGSLEFLNRCPTGKDLTGGVKVDVTPWPDSIKLPKLGAASCVHLSSDCALPALP